MGIDAQQAIDPALLERLLRQVESIARAAGAVIERIYDTDFKVEAKTDSSPVTLADEAAETVILQRLANLPADLAPLAAGQPLPIVAEESVAAGRVPLIPITNAHFWLVDPLDGTKEFISRNGEFTVNIALIIDGEPVLGVVLAPALGALYSGARGIGAFREDASGRNVIRCRAVPDEGLAVVASRSHGDEHALDAFLAGRKVATRVNAGSSLKLCLLAEGRADLYPRLGRTMEWDIAAGHAVLDAAGGTVRRIDNAGALRYGKAGFENPHFVAEGAAV